ncbi:unknown [Clostridium sp. CAG:762]|nr:unknown [Clostridium sp. CAG:762]
MISCNKEIIFNIKNKLVILLSSIVIISFIIMIILAHLLKVEKYYQNKGIVVLDKDNYYLKLYVDFENIETIINNSSILINEDNYQYNIISISDLLESNYDNYQIFYLQILNPNKNLLVNNLVINYKILTGRESLIKYIKKIVKE